MKKARLYCSRRAFFQVNVLISSRRRLPTRRAKHRKAHSERAATPLFALHVELRIVPLQHMLDDGETQARAACIARAATVDAIETLGQTWNVRCRNPQAAVRDRKNRTAAVGLPTHLDRT